MLGTTKIIAVAVIIIVAAASVGVGWMALKGGDDARVSIDAKLEVFGNANGDDVIDQADLSIIQSIIDGETALESYPLADADCNGVVNQLDYNLTNNIINADSGHKVRINIINYHIGSAYIDSVLYPITSAAATASLNSLLAFKYLGIINELKGLSYSSLDSALFSEYIGIMNTFPTLGINVYTMDVERVSACVTNYGISAIISEDNVAYLPNASPGSNILNGTGVDVVRIKPGVVDSKEYMSSILMLAFLFDTDGKGYMEKCKEVIEWYEDFFTDLNNKLGGVRKKASAVASSMTTSISLLTSNNTDIILAAGAEYPLADMSSGSSTSVTFTRGADTWLYNYKIDYLILLRGSSSAATGPFSWYGGTAMTTGSNTVKGYFSNWESTECYQKGNVYVVCGDMPVVLRVAYIAQILYPNVFGQDFAYKYNLDFVQKFFGWDENMIKGKLFSVSMGDAGITL